MYKSKRSNSLTYCVSRSSRSMAETTFSTFTTTLASLPTTDDSSRSYYLSGALITLVLFRGDNYTECTTKLSNSIIAKQKLGFLGGTIMKLSTEPGLSRCLATNSMLVGWIRISVNPKKKTTVSFVPEAHKLWIIFNDVS